MTPEERQEVEQAAATLLNVGRDIVRSQLKAPSTAHFVEDKILMTCPSGTFATLHVFDAQNGFGAMIRGQMCTVFNTKSRRTTLGLAHDLCDSIDYVSRTQPDPCAHWDDIIEHEKLAGASF